MKKVLLFVVILFATAISYSQNSLFTFREPDNSFGDLSAAIVIDPMASIKEKGLCVSIELDCQIKPIYIRPSLTNFAALKDGYTEFNVAIGPNFAFDRFNEIRYYTGVRMGLIKRAEIYPTVGLEAGLNYSPRSSKIYYGGRVTYDYRSDGTYYDMNYGKSNWRQSGYLLVGIKLN